MPSKGKGATLKWLKKPSYTQDEPYLTTFTYPEITQNLLTTEQKSPTKSYYKFPWILQLNDAGDSLIGKRSNGRKYYDVVILLK